MNLFNDEIAVVACADLVGRAGASTFQIGYTGDGATATWWARANYKGATVGVRDLPTPGAAADQLARRLMTGATCRCGLLVSLSNTSDRSRCRWKRVDDRWQPGCDVSPVEIGPGDRGDLAAMRARMPVPR